MMESLKGEKGLQNGCPKQRNILRDHTIKVKISDFRIQRKPWLFPQLSQNFF